MLTNINYIPVMSSDDLADFKVTILNLIVIVKKAQLITMRYG